MKATILPYSDPKTVLEVLDDELGGNGALGEKVGRRRPAVDLADLSGVPYENGEQVVLSEKFCVKRPTDACEGKKCNDFHVCRERG